MGIWARLIGTKDSKAAAVAGRMPPPVESQYETALFAETGPETDPMQGYSGIYASEIIDEKTCTNCAENDSQDYTSMEEARYDYPDGGYRGCESGSGCRGTLVFFRDGN